MLVPWRVIALRHVPGPVQAFPEAKQAALQLQSNESSEVGVAKSAYIQDFEFKLCISGMKSDQIIGVSMICQYGVGYGDIIHQEFGILELNILLP